MLAVHQYSLARFNEDRSLDSKKQIFNLKLSLIIHSPPCIQVRDEWGNLGN